MQIFQQLLIVSSLLSTYSVFGESYYKPNDTYFSQQWNLHNSGPFSNSDRKGKVPGADHGHVAEGWYKIMEQKGLTSLSKVGEKVRIAIIDDGFDLEHEDLKGKFVAVRNFGDTLTGRNMFEMSPRDFHGTLVTGIAAAHGDNGVGIAGACPGCKIIAARMRGIPPKGISEEEYIGAVMDWVIAQKPDIINCSWGPEDTSKEFWQKIIDRLRRGRGGKGVVLVAAAGNDGKDLKKNALASHPYTITVGGSSSLGTRQSYNRFGKGLDLLAPSPAGIRRGSQYLDRIYSTDNYQRPTCKKYGSPHSYKCSDRAGLNPISPLAGGDGWTGKYSYRFSHTSAAAPLVSGIAALILAANPSLTADEVQEILQSTSDKVDALNGEYDSNGWSPTHGHGRVNAAAAIDRAFEF